MWVPVISCVTEFVGTSEMVKLIDAINKCRIYEGTVAFEVYGGKIKKNNNNNLGRKFLIFKRL
jgi:hypothetical protein